MISALKVLGFLALTATIFSISFAVLFAFDFVPESEPQTAASSQKVESKPVEIEQVEEPIRIVAKDIDLDASVVNPTSKDITTLDKALMSGAVRYPGTALLGEEGTALLFGHSSYLPLVQNKNYKIFNDVQKLEKGSIVSLYSGTKEYRYEVVRIDLAKATADRIDLEQNGRFLKLVTCNSFGAKEDRFVVTAEFVGVYEIQNP
jgi:LPXTG-site transpeptidase (sortase) family protein